MEVMIKHLISTAHASRSVVLVDCRGVQGKLAMLRVAAIRKSSKVPFSYECTNMTRPAREEFSRVWTSDPQFALNNWPGGINDDGGPTDQGRSVLRLATHQCLSKKCRTKYCAWADSDLLMMPAQNVTSTKYRGWTGHMRQCLQDDKKKPVFSGLRWFSDLTPRRMKGWSTGDPTPIEPSFAEFSSQAFVVDRARFFNWLPFSVGDMSTWRGSMAHRNLDSKKPAELCAIEGMIVSKIHDQVKNCLHRNGFQIKDDNVNSVKLGDEESAELADQGKMKGRLEDPDCFPSVQCDPPRVLKFAHREIDSKSMTMWKTLVESLNHIDTKLFKDDPDMDPQLLHLSWKVAAKKLYD